MVVEKKGGGGMEGHLCRGFLGTIENASDGGVEPLP